MSDVISSGGTVFFVVFGFFVKSCLQWGRDERTALGL